MKSATRVTGSITASGTAAANLVSANVRTAQVVAVEVSGTFVGTLTFEATLDGSTWHSVAAAKSDANPYTTVVSTAAAAGVWVADVTPYLQFRARCSAYTSGTVVAVVTSAFSGFRAPGN